MRGKMGFVPVGTNIAPWGEVFRVEIGSFSRLYWLKGEQINVDYPVVSLISGNVIESIWSTNHD